MLHLVPLTREQANAVYDVLVRHVGAPDGIQYDGAREDFVAALSGNAEVEVYRLVSRLGLGGKFWRNPGLGGAERWYVTAYPEDTMRDPTLHEVINRTNAALESLRALYTEAA